MGRAPDRSCAKVTNFRSLIYSTFGSAEEARSVAKTLLQEKLIACANHFVPI
ncbi:MAG: divalent cation tolerance protein CutA [Sphingomonadales bacterium]|nr:divalent cation tolerance protein CutA [Sphingomonadales bacterium]